MFGKLLMGLGADGANEVGKTVGMYSGGTLLGGAAGGMMNLMSGDQEDFIGSVMGGAAMGLAGGAAVRSLTSRGGYLNDFGLAIGRTMDSGLEVRRAEQLTKLEDRLAKAEGDEAAKISEQITALNNQEGGGMTRFFTGLSENASERQTRVMKEYEGLAAEGEKRALTESETNRMAKLESDFGIQRNTKMDDVDIVRARTPTGSDDYRAMDEAEFSEFVRAQNKKGEGVQVHDPRAFHPDLSDVDYGPNIGLNFDDLRGYGSGLLDFERRRVPAAGYQMHQDVAQNSISSRNRGLIVGGAGLTGAMVGYSHSQNRKSKRRGFNSTRGSRF